MRWLTLIFTLIPFSLSLGGIIFFQEKQLQAKIETTSQTRKAEEEAERLFLNIQANVPSFGLENLRADWNYLQFIQYFGDTPARELTGYSLIPDFFKVIVKDDPRFVRAMLFLSTANSIYAASPGITVKLLDQALQKISPEIDPLTPYLWSYKGIDEMLFLGDIKASQKSYEMAAQWALKSKNQDRQLIAQRNLEIAAFLAQNPDSRKARVGAWMYILRGAINKETQRLAIREIKALGGKVSINSEGLWQVDFPEKD
jgi:hypothetical protein